MDFRFLCPDKWDMSRGFTFSCLSVVIIVRRSKWLVHFPSSFAAATIVYPVNVFQEAVSWTKLHVWGFFITAKYKGSSGFHMSVGRQAKKRLKILQGIGLCPWHKYMDWSIFRDQTLCHHFLLWASLSVPNDVHPFFTSFFPSNFKVSQQDSPVFVFCPPTKVHCIVEPHCKDKGFCPVVAKVLCWPNFSISSSFNPSALIGRCPFPCWQRCTFLRLDSKVVLDFANSLSLKRQCGFPESRKWRPNLRWKGVSVLGSSSVPSSVGFWNFMKK